jgi:hypothetical protein
METPSSTEQLKTPWWATKLAESTYSAADLHSTGQARIVGGIGVSGDTSCADHNIARRVRNNLGLDHLSGVGGVSGDPARPDNLIFDNAPNP